jgi:hypothetical protein
MRKAEGAAEDYGCSSACGNTCGESVFGGFLLSGVGVARELAAVLNSAGDLAQGNFEGQSRYGVVLNLVPELQKIWRGLLIIMVYRLIKGILNVNSVRVIV